MKIIKLLFNDLYFLFLELNFIVFVRFMEVNSF